MKVFSRKIVVSTNSRKLSPLKVFLLYGIKSLAESLGMTLNEVSDPPQLHKHMVLTGRWSRLSSVCCGWGREGGHCGTVHQA